MTSEMSRRERLEWRIEHSSRGADSAWDDVCGELRDLWEAQAIAESDMHQAREWLDLADDRLQQEQEQSERAREAHIQTRNDLEARLQQEQDHSADLSRQLRIVREWMAQYAYSLGDRASAAIRLLSKALLWSDDAERPEPDRPRGSMVHDEHDMTDITRGIAHQAIEEAAQQAPSPGAIAVTASLFERVAVLEDEMIKLGDRLHVLDGDLNRQIQSLTEALRDVADIHPGGM